MAWFSFPNENWIHPLSLTVCRAGYAALQPVSMEILRSCSVPTPQPPPTSSNPPPTSSAVHSCGDLGQSMCVCVIQHLVNRHTSMYGVIDGYAYAIVVVLSSIVVNVQVCVSQSPAVWFRCVFVCVILVVTANLEALLKRMSKCVRARVWHCALQRLNHQTPSGYWQSVCLFVRVVCMR